MPQDGVGPPFPPTFALLACMCLHFDPLLRGSQRPTFSTTTLSRTLVEFVAALPRFGNKWAKTVPIPPVSELLAKVKVWALPAVWPRPLRRRVTLTLLQYICSLLQAQKSRTAAVWHCGSMGNKALSKSTRPHGSLRQWLERSEEDQRSAWETRRRPEVVAGPR